MLQYIGEESFETVFRPYYWEIKRRLNLKILSFLVLGSNFLRRWGYSMDQGSLDLQPVFLKSLLQLMSHEH